MDKELILRNLLMKLRFYHFTDVRNLQSIFKFGLRPLSALKALGIAPFVFDGNRHDRAIFENGAICVSVGHSARAMARVAHENHYAILELDPLIWLEPGNRLASPTNAASEMLTIAAGVDFPGIWKSPSRLEFLKSRYGIFTLFADPFTVVYDSGREYSCNRLSRATQLGLPNDPQAELLFDFMIPTSAIKAVFLKTVHAKDVALAHLGSDLAVPVRVDPRLFGARFDADRWQERRADFVSAEVWVREVLKI